MTRALVYLWVPSYQQYGIQVGTEVWVQLVKEPTAAWAMAADDTPGLPPSPVK